MKISSLNKLSDIRSNRAGVTLLHYVASQAEESNEELLTLPDDFAILEEASKTPIDILQVEINKLESQIRKIQNQIKAPTVNQDVKELMSDFLQVSKSFLKSSKEKVLAVGRRLDKTYFAHFLLFILKFIDSSCMGFLQYASSQVSRMKEGIESLSGLRTELSEFFCEDPKSFRIEDCFTSLGSFCSKFKQAVGDNAKRREQEQRRAQREAEADIKRRNNGKPLYCHFFCCFTFAAHGII